MDRRELAEENYRKKFDELGLSERFELVRRIWEKRSDRRFWCRCKTCGTEFLRSNDVLRGKQQRLLCPECGAASDGNDIFARSQIVKDAAEYYVQGHTVKETAEQFGITKWQVNTLVKTRKLTNGRAFGDPVIRNLSGLQAANESRHQASVKRKAEEAEQRTLEKQRKELERQEKIKQAEELREQKTHEKERAKAEKADALFHLLNDKTHVCSVCGKYFSISEFMENKGRRLIPTNPKYCSRECENKHNNRKSKECKRRRGVQDGHRHRAKKYGCAYDPTVTLPRLIKRDGLRCAICGEMCDPNDNSWSKYSGPMYPSIDHIVPMSKGGGHVWENVQVAHIICNSNKSDKVVGE